MNKVLSVNISEKKGTIKKPIDKIIIDKLGIVNDAHAGNWHRQVSLLSCESIEKFSLDAKRKINFGEFAENITTQGIELHTKNIFDRFIIGDTELELTQIGKECHGTKCAIFKEVGNCVMPQEGIFCRVIKTGSIKPGDEINYIPKVYKALIVTLSDRASKGEYKDLSGPKIKEILQNYFNDKGWRSSIENDLIPDEAYQLQKILLQAKEENIDFVFTTGGTGISSRDITIETVTPFLDKQIPGIMEAIRIKYGTLKHQALLSRSIAGVMGNSLVFSLPGSVKAVTEYMAEINMSLEHLVFMLKGIDKH